MKEYYELQGYNGRRCKLYNYKNVLINIRTNNDLIITCAMKKRVFSNCSLIVIDLRVYIIFLNIFEDKVYFKMNMGCWI